MRAFRQLTVCALLATASCSDPKRHKVQDIDPGGRGASYYLYRSGGTIDDFITIELREQAEYVTLVSVSFCDSVSARRVGNKLEVIAFDARLSVGRLDANTTAAQTELDMIVRNRAPTAHERSKLTDEGFSTIRCAELG